jgi:hypothetical protein
MMYSFATWTSGIIHIHSFPLCMPYPQYYHLLTTVTGVDSAVTLIIPCSIVIILNIRIARRIVSLERSRQPLVRHLQNGMIVQCIARKSTGTMRGDSLSSGCPVHVRFQNHACSGRPENGVSEPVHAIEVPMFVPTKQKSSKSKVRGSSQQYRTARMLIVVSSVFVVLNLPGHVFKIHAFIQSSLHDEFSAFRRDLTWHEIFQLVYHLNFSVNFFIYSACGRQFRTGLRILYTRLRHKTKHWQKLYYMKKKSETPHYGPTHL